MARGDAISPQKDQRRNELVADVAIGQKNEVVVRACLARVSGVVLMEQFCCSTNKQARVSYPHRAFVAPTPNADRSAQEPAASTRSSYLFASQPLEPVNAINTLPLRNWVSFRSIFRGPEMFAITRNRTP